MILRSSAVLEHLPTFTQNWSECNRREYATKKKHAQDLDSKKNWDRTNNTKWHIGTISIKSKNSGMSSEQTYGKLKRSEAESHKTKTWDHYYRLHAYIYIDIYIRKWGTPNNCQFNKYGKWMCKYNKWQ